MPRLKERGSGIVTPAIRSTIQPRPSFLLHHQPTWAAHQTILKLKHGKIVTRKNSQSDGNTADLRTASKTNAQFKLIWFMTLIDKT